MRSSACSRRRLCAPAISAAMRTLLRVGKRWQRRSIDAPAHARQWCVHGTRRRFQVLSVYKRTTVMIEHPRIALDPDVLAGKPVIRGTRLSVEFVIGLMADGWGEADILANYPGSCTMISSLVSPMPVTR